MTTDTKGKSLQDLSEIALKEAEEALKHPYVFKKPLKNVVVIGAGPAGLPTARHLRELGINVRVFDRNSTAGGLWVYSERPPLKPKIPTSRLKREIDHAVLLVKDREREERTFELTPEIKNLLLEKCPPSACYRDLYNNTATHLMAYPDFPFPKDTPWWCPHPVISQYLKDYAKEFDLFPLIEFNTSVDRVIKKDETTWELTLSKYEVYADGLVKVSRWKETFDAVVVASGLHQEPYVPDIKDLIAYTKKWPDKESHSNQFRRPEDYKDKDVLIVGGSISAVDTARALDGFAKSITVSIDGPFESPFPIFNLVRATLPKSTIIKSNIEAFSNADGEVDGTILFKDGSTIDNVDHVIFCTGFLNRLNYLGDLAEEKDEAEVQKEQSTIPRPSYIDVPESHVVIGPRFPLNVYREVFVISDPTLAFVGQPQSLSTFSHFDTQAHAVARVWSGHALLPNKELMDKFTSEFDSGISPFAIFDADRRRREPFISWLNYHAKVIKQSDDGAELKPLENYRDDYEAEGQKTMDAWSDISEKNLQRIKQYIREHITYKL